MNLSLSNKAMQTDGHCAAAADRQDVRSHTPTSRLPCPRRSQL